MKKLLVLFLCLLCTALCFADGVKASDSIESLNGKNIGVQTAVLYEELIAKTVPDTVFQYYTMPTDMIAALKSGKISAYLIEEVGFGVHKASHPELAKMEQIAGYIDATCIMGNNEKKDVLLKQLNEFILQCRQDGTSDYLYDYWISNFDPQSCTCDTTGFTGENGHIAVAIEGGYEPFSFVADGQLAGYDVDFICRFSRQYGYIPDFYEVPFESIAPGVETGKYDIGMNIVVSAERNETGTLTEVYYSCPVVLVCLDGEGEDISFWERTKNSFYKTFIRDNRYKLFAQGALVTVIITICSILAGTIVGFAVFLACRHGNRIANTITDFFLWLTHGMPTVLLLMILYYIVFGSSRLDGMWVSVIGFSLMFACSMYDMLVVGYKAIGRGQFEASKALGYTESQSFFKIILPQSAQHFLPIYRSEIVTLIKETSVVGYIAVLDLTKISDLVRSRTYEAFFPLVFTAVMYFLIAAVMTRIVKQIEISINPKRRSQDKILKGIKQWD